MKSAYDRNAGELHFFTLRAGSIHTGTWSLSIQSATVSYQILPVSTQTSLKANWCLYLKLSSHPLDALNSLFPTVLATSCACSCTGAPDTRRFLAAHLHTTPLHSHCHNHFQFSLVSISLNHYYNLVTYFLFQSRLLICPTDWAFPALNFATIPLHLLQSLLILCWDEALLFSLEAMATTTVYSQI